jgi:putative ABC transport system permease protein
MLLRLALRELKRSWKFGIFFVINLSLGLTGYVSLEAFNEALRNQIRQNAKSILSADFAVSSRREITDAEIKSIRDQIPRTSAESKVYEFFAMLNSSKGSRLVLVKAIDEKYPFYGSLDLQSGRVINSYSADREIFKEPKAWIYPELTSQLGLKVGDDISLGSLSLKIADVVKKDQTQTFRAAALAPRVFLNRDLLSQSGLLQYGSTFSLAYLYKFPEDSKPDLIKAQIYKKLSDPQISIDTPETAGEDSGRQLSYLSDYLGLVAIVALFMSALGAAYLYRLFIFSRLKEVAILRTLGLHSGEALSVYIIQAGLLGIISTLPTVLMSSGLLPILSTVLASFTPFDLVPHVSLTSIGMTLFMAVAGSFVVSLPFLVKIYDLKASKLFSEEKFSTERGKFRIWPYLPGLGIFYFLSVYQSKSWKTGSLFAGTMLVVITLLLIIGWGAIKFVAISKMIKRWHVRFSFLSLSRRARSSLAIFVALGLGALLINILPQLKNSLQAEFRVEGRSKIPSLFMFDIQDEQINGVLDFLREKKIEPLGVSPLVRARILKANGVDYERKIEAGGFKTREEEREARFRNRGVNLSYRKGISTSEILVKGRPFNGDFNPATQKRGELSVEVKFAERMGFKIGDVIVFDVQGVEIEGEIVNFRKVKWTSFQPNFFILFQAGVLEEAPKTFITAIPSLGEERRASLQNDIVKKFSNISVVDVVRTVDEALKTAEKMSWSLELMAALALLTGYIVLFSIVRSQIQQRRWELNLLKILGANQREVTVFLLTEFAYLSFGAAMVGALLSVLVSFGLNTFIFENDFTLYWLQPISSVVLITALSITISFLASSDVVKESALGILREGK